MSKRNDDDRTRPESRDALSRKETLDVQDAATDAKNMDRGAVLVTFRGGKMECHVYRHERRVK